jgi:hypothetical protein
MRLACALTAILALSACKKTDPEATTDNTKPQATESGAGPVVTKDISDEGLQVVERDLNNDKRSDTFTYQRPRPGQAPLIVRKEQDINFDGKIDIVSFFSLAGVLEREEYDGDFDGKTEITDYFQPQAACSNAPLRVSSEADTDFDGRPDKFTYYTANAECRPRPTHEERDENGDGKIDYWLRYDDKGAVVISGKDTNGDGRMDVREE